MSEMTFSGKNIISGMTQSGTGTVSCARASPRQHPVRMHDIMLPFIISL